MVLDAMEDTLGREEDDDIPLLDRHLAKRDFEVPTRVMSKEEILQQRQEMLQEEKEMNELMDEEEDMDDETPEQEYDYSTAFFQ